MEIEAYASGSSGNAYRVSDGHTVLLIEAGIPIRQIQICCGFNLKQFDGCLISHCHGDHAKAAADIAGRGIDIWTSAGTINACGLRGHRIHAVEALQSWRIGSFDVLAFDVQHDAPEPLGFLIASVESKERLLFFTDTYYIKYKFNGLTHIMAECNYSRDALREAVASGSTPEELAPRLYRSHMSLETLLEMLRSNDLSRVKQIYLMHLSQNNSDAAAFKRTVQQETGAEVYIC